MSRIGLKPIHLTSDVKVVYDNGVFTITGPKGTLTREVDKRLEYTINPTEILVKNNHPLANKNMKALHGLYRQLIANMVEGVVKGFEKKLVINGVGYRIALKSPTEAVLNIGFSHPVVVNAPEGITLNADKNSLTISGIDKELVGRFASSVRDIKPVEPYHAYGIAYSDEVVIRRETKTGKK